VERVKPQLITCTSSFGTVQAASTINTTLGTGFGTRFSEVHDEADPPSSMPIRPMTSPNCTDGCVSDKSHRASRARASNPAPHSEHGWGIELSIAGLFGYRLPTIRYERHARLFCAFLTLAAVLTCYEKLAKTK
jgi:hypothetical protein